MLNDRTRCCASYPPGSAYQSTYECTSGNFTVHETYVAKDRAAATGKRTKQTDIILSRTVDIKPDDLVIITIKRALKYSLISTVRHRPDGFKSGAGVPIFSHRRIDVITEFEVTIQKVVDSL